MASVPVITIRERPGAPGGPNATVSFDGGPAEYDCTISDPFSPEEEAELEWYFEEHLRFPFVGQARARAAAASIPRYGEALFRMVFADYGAHHRYSELIDGGLSTIRIEVAGPPDFHRLHWEALKDPRLPEPLALQAVVVRQNLRPAPVRAGLRPSPTVNVLVVTARPGGRRDVGYRTISRPLVEGLRQARLPVRVQVLRPGTYAALAHHLDDTTARHGAGYYHIVHFDVHGALLTYAELSGEVEPGPYQFGQRYRRRALAPYEGRRAYLALEGEGEAPADLVEAAELADLLVAHGVPIVILNACQSGKQVGASETSLGSRVMQAGVQLALAMGYSITVSAAQVLMETLYRQLFAGQDVATAIRLARLELAGRRERRAYFDQTIELEDWLLPVAYQNQAVRLAPRAFTPEEAQAYYGGLAARYAPAPPEYGFVGRDLDILAIERRRLQRGNVLLLRGLGGAGKTTLLRHLGAWWQTTGFVAQVFEFAYDARAWSRQQIMDALAQHLLRPEEYQRSFQSLSLEAQQQMLAQRLRGERHLLILDNLESITGAHLAIQHTLPAEEREALRGFLAALAGGQTVVLLGSRGAEAWLAPGTFGDNVYELPGLDPEAASTLADRVLARHGATRHRGDADLERLLRLLDGYPLALQVVLANLATQTPDQVLEALRAGDVALDRGEAQEKTESILRCIDYAHSNLPWQAQGLLLCLAPFTGVLDTGLLAPYTEELRQEAPLAGLPFEHWPEVLRAASDWGLAAPHPEQPGYLRLQPTFPYFLRGRLQAPDQSAAREAIEAAFRRLYAQVGQALAQLMQSKEPAERQTGQAAAALEYENLHTALRLSLADRSSIGAPYGALSYYLDATHDEARGLELGEMVLVRLEEYPAEALAGPLGTNLVGVIGTIAARQLALRQYAAAQESYEKAQSLLAGLTALEPRQKALIAAGICQQLGLVDQERRLWPEAEQRYRQALQICVEFSARYEQASTYHRLGLVAEEQRRWPEAKEHYRQALQIFVEFSDRHSQASTYHQLGRVAQEQRRWPEAEEHYRQALQIFVEFSDRYEQAEVYHQLGMVAQKQRRWPEAEKHYRQALQIKIEFNDRYAQASTYHNLGIMAQDQRRWPEAREGFLTALRIYHEYQDEHYRGLVLGSLARLWRVSGDAGLPAAVGAVLGLPADEAEQLLRAALEPGPGAAAGEPPADEGTPP